MFKIDAISWHKLQYRNLDKDSNSFLYLTGNNGSGKSTFLLDVADVILNNASKLDGVSIKYSGKPEKIITYTMAPFSKFETKRFRNITRGDDVKRVGVSFNSGRHGLFFQAATEFVSTKPSKVELFEEIAAITGLSLQFKIIFSVSGYRMRQVIHNKLLSDREQEVVSELLSYKGSYTLSIEPGKILIEKANLARQNIDISLNLHSIFSEQTLLDVLLRVRSFGGMLIKEVEMFTLGGWRKLDDFSSGQMSFFIGLVILAGSLEDNSIILIDEPETSLHPEWQRSFCDVLYKIAEHNKNCYFFIATHSAILIASVNGKKNTHVYNIGNDMNNIEDVIDNPKSIEDIFAMYFDIYTPNSFLVKNIIMKAIDSYEKRESDLFESYKTYLRNLDGIEDSDTKKLIKEILKRSVK